MNIEIERMIEIMKQAGTWDMASDSDIDDPEPKPEIKYSHGESCSRRCYVGRMGKCSETTCPYI